MKDTGQYFSYSQVPTWRNDKRIIQPWGGPFIGIHDNMNVLTTSQKGTRGNPSAISTDPTVGG